MRLTCMFLLLNPSISHFRFSRITMIFFVWHVVCFEVAGCIDRSKQKKESEEPSRNSGATNQRIVYPFSNVYNQRPFIQNTQPSLQQYPRFHVVHPNDHVDDVFDALFQLNDAASKIRYRNESEEIEDLKEHASNEPVHYQRVMTPFGERYVRVQSTNEASSERAEKKIKVDAPKASHMSVGDIHEESNLHYQHPSSRTSGPIRSLFTVTIKLFSFGLLASIILSFIYSVYRHRTYTQIDEFGNVMNKGVIGEFKATIRKLFRYLKRLNPLRREESWSSSAQSFEYEENKYGENGVRRFDDFERVN